MAIWECESRGANGLRVNKCPEQGQNLKVILIDQGSHYPGTSKQSEIQHLL